MRVIGTKHVSRILLGLLVLATCAMGFFIAHAFAGSHAAGVPGAVKFAPPVNYPLPGSPISIVTGDFNNDGIPDLIALTYQGGILALGLGNGDGTFQPFTGIDGGCKSFYIADGDFNNDGNLDLAISSSQTLCGVGMNVVYGTGHGTVSGGVALLPTGDPSAVQIVVADLNGDGNQDIAFTGGQNFVYVFLGNGDGTFQNLRKIAGGGLESSGLTVGDVNGDGIPDLIVTNLKLNNSNGNVSVLLGNGDGSFESPIRIMAGPSPTQSAVGDFNGDSKLDIAVAESGQVKVFLGNGDGSFTIGAVLRTPGPYVGWIATADFNGDGKTDIAVVNSAITPPINAVVVFPGNGDGTFQPQGTFNVGGDPGQMVVGDFNRDGKPDIAIVNFGHLTATVLINSTSSPAQH